MTTTTTITTKFDRYLEVIRTIRAYRSQGLKCVEINQLFGYRLNSYRMLKAARGYISRIRTILHYRDQGLTCGEINQLFGCRFNSYRILRVAGL